MGTEKETIDGCEKKEADANLIEVEEKCVNEEDREDEEVREEEAEVEGKGEDVDEDEGVNKIDGEESEKKSEISKKRSREQSKGEKGELPGSEMKMVEIFITPKASASYAKKMLGRGRGRGRGRHGDRLSQLFPQSIVRRSQPTPSPSISSGGVPELGDLSLAGGSSSSGGVDTGVGPSSTASAADSTLRTRCYITEVKILEPEFVVAQLITQTFHNYLEVGSHAWRVVSDETNDRYWEEFKKHFYWDEGTEDEIWEYWAKKAWRCYSDMVSEAKRKRMNEGRPPYVPESVWSSWCDYWDSEEAQAVSARAKKNRLSVPDGEGTGQIRHLGGSRSAAAHAIALAQESGGSVGGNLYATFQRYHFKNGEYTDAKSKLIGDEVERRLEEARQPLPDGTLPPLVDPNAIYLEIIGGPNSKNRIFGIGSLYSGSQSATSPVGYSPSQPFTSVGPTPEQIHEQIQQQVQEQLAAQRAVYETLLKESQDKFREDISALKSTMMDFITHGTQPRPGSGSGS